MKLPLETAIMDHFIQKCKSPSVPAPLHPWIRPTFCAKGPFIYDVHTEGDGDQAQVDACRRGGDQAPCGRPHRKLKLEPTDVILFSSHAKKSFFTRISSLDGTKSRNVW